MKKSEKLIKLLSEKYGITITNVKRTYAGIWQKRLGQFTWEALINGYPTCRIGSQWTITELLKAKKLEFDSCIEGLAIYPEHL